MSLINKHRQIILQLFLLLIFILIVQWIVGILPGLIGIVARTIVTLIWVIFLGTAIIFLLLQIIQNFRFERYFVPENFSIRPLPLLKNYHILNPLDIPGSFYKAQLHAHTSLSYDSKMSPEDVIQSYQDDGYHILAITDHDRYTDFSNLSTEEMMVLAGVEETIPILFWPMPLGKHLVLINPPNHKLHKFSIQERINQANDQDSLVIPAHLSWRGGAGTGRWFPEELYRLKKIQFIEIMSPHSRDPIDFLIWNKLIKKNGPKLPVWGIAVDDSHTGSREAGWIMVKMPEFSPSAFFNSIKKGAFFATSGPQALDIEVIDRKISVRCPDAEWIRFFNAQNEVVFATRDEETVYQTYGDEGFIRIEVSNQKDQKAWSQPMWLVSN